MNKFQAPSSVFSVTAWPSDDTKWSTEMKNLSYHERVKKEEILSHIALRQYFMQSLCHLNLTPYTVFETNVVACHITAEHSSKSLDW